MEEINKKGQLLLKIVSENNSLLSKLRKASYDEKAIWEEVIRKLINLGKTMLDYSNFLTVEELQDFVNLYRTAQFITSPRMSPAGVRAESTKQFTKMVDAQEELFQSVFIPTMPLNKDQENKQRIREQIDTINYNLNSIAFGFLNIEKRIDIIVASQKNVTEDGKTLLKGRLTQEFQKISDLTDYVREYFEGIKKIILEVIDNYVSPKEFSDMKEKLKQIERMTNRIWASFNTMNVSRIDNNVREVEDMVSQTKHL